MGSYNITENKSDGVKFRCMVSFNGNSVEYWEHDSLDSQEIAAALQSTADVAESATTDNAAVAASMAAIEISDGKIIEGK